MPEYISPFMSQSTDWTESPLKSMQMQAEAIQGQRQLGMAKYIDQAQQENKSPLEIYQGALSKAEPQQRLQGLQEQAIMAQQAKQFALSKQEKADQFAMEMHKTYYDKGLYQEGNSALNNYIKTNPDSLLKPVPEQSNKSNSFNPSLYNTTTTSLKASDGKTYEVLMPKVVGEVPRYLNGNIWDAKGGENGKGSEKGSVTGNYPKLQLTINTDTGGKMVFNKATGKLTSIGGGGNGLQSDPNNPTLGDLGTGSVYRDAKKTYDQFVLPNSKWSTTRNTFNSKMDQAMNLINDNKEMNPQTVKILVPQLINLGASGVRMTKSEIDMATHATNLATELQDKTTQFLTGTQGQQKLSDIRNILNTLKSSREISEQKEINSAVSGDPHAKYIFGSLKQAGIYNPDLIQGNQQQQQSQGQPNNQQQYTKGSIITKKDGSKYEYLGNGDVNDVSNWKKVM